MLDHVTALQRRLQRETDAAPGRGMRYPTSWDPFFSNRRGTPPQVFQITGDVVDGAAQPITAS
jgi:hypothetical protein